MFVLKLSGIQILLLGFIKKKHVIKIIKIHVRNIENYKSNLETKKKYL